MKEQINKTCFNGIKMRLFIFLIAITTLSFSSCKKYLEEKPDKKLSTPSTIEDLEAILDNYKTLNTRYPSAGEIGSDNYYLTDTDWASIIERQRNFYLWQKYDDIGGDWSVPYNNIFYANIILETLDKIQTDNSTGTDQLKGSALFIRGFNHFSLSQLFAPPYNADAAIKDLGIPIRLHSDVNIIPVRATIPETYYSILSDLKNAVPLLPVYPIIKYHPSRPAAYALLARVYLSMSEYDKAGLYADSCLQLYNRLMDYNSINTSSTIPFRQFNDEVIYDARTGSPAALVQSKAKVDTTLYSLYGMNDLRRTIFFKSNTNGSKAFKGNYTGISSAALFVGLATDEAYLIRAESFARQGKTTVAIQDLNTLMVKRCKAGTFNPFVLTDATETLRIILEERRKELLYRTLRWSDLRRLNKEANFADTIYRKINGQKYQLLPGSQRYTFQIDRQAINISGIQQNP